jgi:hypothetical protein
MRKLVVLLAPKICFMFIFSVVKVSLKVTIAFGKIAEMSLF